MKECKRMVSKKGNRGREDRNDKRERKKKWK